MSKESADYLCAGLVILLQRDPVAMDGAWGSRINASEEDALAVGRRKQLRFIRLLSYGLQCIGNGAQGMDVVVKQIVDTLPPQMKKTWAEASHHLQVGGSTHSVIRSYQRSLLSHVIPTAGDILPPAQAAREQ